METKTTLLNFRISESLKEKFQQVCKERNTSMTSILNEKIYDYVSAHPDVIENEWEPIVLSDSSDDIHSF